MGSLRIRRGSVVLRPAPEIAREESAARRKARIAKLKKDDDQLWTDFQKASDRIAMAAKIIRDGGDYSELNKGKIDYIRYSWSVLSSF